MTTSEFAFEPIRGLPEELPKGEHILWQGAPAWWALARSAFHVRKVAIYFGILLIWRVVSSIYDGKGVQELATGAGTLIGVGALAVALLCLLAWLQARSTVYTVTNKRVVVRGGAALTLAINIPYARVVSAGLKENRDGTGDIPLKLSENDRVAYFHLWPHARPWRFKHPEPMLRAIPDATEVAQILSQALAEALNQRSAPKVRKATRKRRRAAPRRPVAVAAE